MAAFLLFCCRVAGDAVPRFESFGMVALEAMACGTPVIASDVGGLTTLVQDGKTGYRVKVNDAEAMARAIERLMDNEALRRRSGPPRLVLRRGPGRRWWINLLNVYNELADSGQNEQNRNK